MFEDAQSSYSVRLLGEHSGRNGDKEGIAMNELPSDQYDGHDMGHAAEVAEGQRVSLQCLHPDDGRGERRRTTLARLSSLVTESFSRVTRGPNYGEFDKALPTLKFSTRSNIFCCEYFFSMSFC